MDNETKIRSTKQSPHLPEETVEDILSRLPVKPLLRFKCVSKPCGSLISSERFIKIQSENSINNTSFAHHKVILNGNDDGDVRDVLKRWSLQHCSLKQCSLQPLLNEPSLVPDTIYSPTNNQPRTGRVVGHCNGILCILQPWRFSLWNPAIRISFILPRTCSYNNDQCTNFGFGWDEASFAYKVVALYKDIYSNPQSNKVQLEVYSSKTNLWKRTKHNDFGRLYGFLDKRGELLGGKLHWLRGDDTHILTLDLKSEAFGKMELPCLPLLKLVRLRVVGGLLSLVCTEGESLSMWVMKESWEKVMAIPSPPLDLYGSLPYIAPLFIGVNGEILLLYQSTFLVYNPHENEFSLPREIMCGRDQHYAHVYVESLVLPLPHMYKNINHTR